MEQNRAFCVESGDLFSFDRGKDEQDAAMWFIVRILGIRGATLGETCDCQRRLSGEKTC